MPTTTSPGCTEAEKSAMKARADGLRSSGRGRRHQGRRGPSVPRRRDVWPTEFAATTMSATVEKIISDRLGRAAGATG